ncbi:MAG: hypothetical protein C0505_01105 [Leptothrix sp. (in: Bacteria)]|nr:hypothetical protein [Leptothrix sp. (in: b-proteobacteria)]
MGSLQGSGAAARATAGSVSRHRAAALARRQQLLLLRSHELRGRFAADALRWQPTLALADRLRAGWHWLLAHPEVPLAATVVLAVMRPRRALRWGWRLWSGWRTWQRLQARLQPPPGRFTTR